MGGEVGWVGDWCVRYGWIGGRREKVSGVYGFSSLAKQNKKGKNCAVFCFAGKRIFFFNICDVITSPEKEQSSANHYSSLNVSHCIRRARVVLESRD